MVAEDKQVSSQKTSMSCKQQVCEVSCEVSQRGGLRPGINMFGRQWNTVFEKSQTDLGSSIFLVISLFFHL